MVTNTPLPPRAHTKGQPPERVETRDNLIKSEPNKIVALNFKVPADFKKDFKIASATLGITQSELLQRAFKLWNENNPIKEQISSEDKLEEVIIGFRFSDILFKVMKHIEKFPGVSSKEIAKEFNVSLSTVRTNLLSLYRKKILSRTRINTGEPGCEYAYFIMNNLND